jgi:CheY-like chemotaxis protein
MSDLQPTCVGSLLNRYRFIVDDDESFRTTLAVLLQNPGYVVQTAEDGSDALLKLRRGFRANLLFMDLEMPVKDGWLLRNELLQDEKLAHLPVVVLSASKSGGACRTASEQRTTWKSLLP